MKKIIPLALLVCWMVAVVAQPVSAQEEKKKKKKQRGQNSSAKRLVTSLKAAELTDEQMAGVKKIAAEHSKGIAELNKKAALTAEQKTARTEATKKANADGVKGKERRDLIAKMMKLSDAQTEAMAELRKKQGEMRKAVMELLTDEQKNKLSKKGKKKDN